MSADGPILAAMNAAKAMLRDCDQWRKLKDADSPWNEATAEAHIHFDALPAADPGPDHTLIELQALRPFAILWADTAGGMRMRNDTDGGCVINSGTIIMQIELDVPDDLTDDPTELAQDLYRKFGRLMKTNDSAAPGLMELTHRAGYLPLLEIQFIGSQRSDTKDAHDIGDVIVAEYQISWGLE